MRALRESDILKQITDGLTAHRIWWMRCNSGGMFGSHNGKRWAVKFGRKGMADLLVMRKYGFDMFRPIWVEVKRPDGELSEHQIAFGREVSSEGHIYIIARDWSYLKEALGL